MAQLQAARRGAAWRRSSPSTASRCTCSRLLTRITCDLQLGVGAEGLRRRAPDMRSLGGLYDQLGFGPFLRRQGERLAQLPVG